MGLRMDLGSISASAEASEQNQYAPLQRPVRVFLGRLGKRRRPNLLQVAACAAMSRRFVNFVVSLFEKSAMALVGLRGTARFAKTGAVMRRSSFFFAALLAPAVLAPVTVFSQSLTLADVQRIMAQAISRAEITSPNALIAVTDREGFVLGVWSVAGGNPSADRVGAAISEAGTPTYLSTNENAFSSRTAQFVI